jgi:hypothetical protein
LIDTCNVLTSFCPWTPGITLTGLRGDVTGLSGNVNGLRGDVSGLSGDVSDCEITDSERKNGVKIEDLIDEKQS